MRPVSGRAVVAGFTINAQPWLPDFPPPYVVAIVALEEDDGARLMTNIIGCDDADVRIGMRVRVQFEQQTDLWIPLFEPDPTAGDELGPLPARRDPRVSLRPMVSQHKFEDKVALTGVGQSRIGRRLGIDPLELALDAATAAVADAGLTMADIDGLSTYPGAGAPDGFSEGGIMSLEEALQLRPTWVNGGMDLPGQIGSIVTAMLAVASGLCRHVLCVRTVWESTHTELVRAGGWGLPSGLASGMMEWRLPFGAVSAANWIACHASAYMDRYGAGRELLGHVAINARANAGRNPEALYRHPLTMDEYLNARPVTTPFGLYDCDVPCDGSTAVIVSSIDAAYDGPRKPVLVEAVGTQILERLSWDQDTLTHVPQSWSPSTHLWSRTLLRPADVDVAEIYDGFTFNAISWLEGLGFCEPGGATDFIDGGRTIALDGRLPMNTHGGQLSAGRLHGYGFVKEAMLQLRGEAHGRQVTDPKVAVVTAGGGVPSGAMLLRSAD